MNKEHNMKHKNKQGQLYILCQNNKGVELGWFTQADKCDIRFVNLINFTLYQIYWKQ